MMVREDGVGGSEMKNPHPISLSLIVQRTTLLMEVLMRE
jgi:hypothetical protein